MSLEPLDPGQAVTVGRPREERPGQERPLTFLRKMAKDTGFLPSGVTARQGAQDTEPETVQCLRLEQGREVTTTTEILGSWQNEAGPGESAGTWAVGRWGSRCRLLWTRLPLQRCLSFLASSSR